MSKHFCPVCSKPAGGSTFYCARCQEWTHPKCGGYSQREVQRVRLMKNSRTEAEEDGDEEDELLCNKCKESSPTTDRLFTLQRFKGQNCEESGSMSKGKSDVTLSREDADKSSLVGAPRSSGMDDWELEDRDGTTNGNYNEHKVSSFGVPNSQEIEEEVVYQKADLEKDEYEISLEYVVEVDDNSNSQHDSLHGNIRKYCSVPTLVSVESDDEDKDSKKCIDRKFLSTINTNKENIDPIIIDDDDSDSMKGEANNDAQLVGDSPTGRKTKVTKKRRTFTCESDNDNDSEIENVRMVVNDNVTLLNILLLNPESYEVKNKPVAIRDDYLCTMNRTVIPIESARADDNGSYIRNGTSKRFFVVSKKDGKIVSSRTCKVDNEKGLYVNVRDGSFYKREYVDGEEVYELAKEYRVSKENDNFQHIIAYVRPYSGKTWSQYYVSCYCWKTGKPDKEFNTPRHGNAKKPTAPVYYRTDPKTLKIAQAKISTSSPRLVYQEMSGTDKKSYSEQIRNPKQLYNAQSQLKERIVKPPKSTDYERLVHFMKNPEGLQFVRSVVMLPDSYAVFAFTDVTMKNLEKLCVHGPSSLRIDTTFEIIDGLWVTDTSYTNSCLINERDSLHPEFPGPLMLHFKKNHVIFQRFALEIINGNPALSGIRKVGHDLDPALKRGLKAIFKDAEILLCVQHVKERDRMKLQDLGASKQATKEILTDIFGCQVNEYVESGLVDSADSEEFQGRLLSLKDVWEEKVKGFYAWFDKKRASLFIEQVIGEALDRLEMSEKFTTNRLENFHKIQKIFCGEGQCNGDPVAVLRACQQWIEFYEKEGEKAFMGQGKYRLAPGYEGFKHPRYLYWSEEEKQEHQEKFSQFIPLEANSYVRPKYAGLKKPQETSRRRGNAEVEIFHDRLQPYLEKGQESRCQNKTVCTDIRYSTEVPSTSSQQVQEEPLIFPGELVMTDDDGAAEDLSFLNPYRVKEKKYMLVHRDDIKNCPKAVRRCENCKVSFDSSDTVLVKTAGRRDGTDAKTGKPTIRHGNIYLHNLIKCLLEYDKNFKYPNVVVLKGTLAKLSKNARAVVLSLKVKVEK